MSFAAEAERTAPEYTDSAPPAHGARMCPQPVELVQDTMRRKLRPKKPRKEWIVDGLPLEYDIRGYCRLCLGSGATTHAVRAPGTRRRGADAHDDGSGGDDGGDGPPGPPQLAAIPEIQTPNAASAATGRACP